MKWIAPKISNTLANDANAVSGKAMSKNSEDITSRCTVTTSSGSATMQSATRHVIGDIQFYSFTFNVTSKISYYSDVTVTISGSPQIYPGNGTGNGYVGSMIAIGACTDYNKINYRILGSSDGITTPFLANFVSPVFK